MQRAKMYKLPSTAYFKGVLFVFERSKILCDELSTLRKNDVFDTNEKFFFSYLNKLFFVNCRALHAASYGIFCFVYESISVDKKNEIMKKEFLIRAEKVIFLHCQKLITWNLCFLSNTKNTPLK